uniref:Uncharacterized protein n=1 Tax=Romanomermis culicivorax TaxID=13658 RepID=A0A915KPW0_ROMCU
MFRYDCPDGYDCSDMTCFEDKTGIRHLEGVICIFPEDCDESYRCEDMTCVQRS